MSEIAIGRDGVASGAFSARTAMLLVVVGIVGFVGMLVMGAFAPDLRNGRNGGAHALSNAAIGYSGLVRLAEATGRNPVVVRNEHLLGTENLVVLTPENGVVNLSVALATRGPRPTVVVLPKWATSADDKHTGWVHVAGLLPPIVPQGVLSPQNRLHIAQHRSGGAPLVVVNRTMTGVEFTAPRPLQVVSSVDLNTTKINGRTTQTGHLVPIITDGMGGTVLGRIDDTHRYVLADPDLLSNLGMRDPRQAASALAMLDWLNSTGADGIAFDVTLNGFGHALSPLKLAFEPPFLAMTLAIGVVLLLVGAQAFARFGAARPRQRAIAFGKTALVDNTAALIRKAGREATLGSRYIDVIRDRAGQAFGAPARLRDAALDAYLDRIGGRSRFTDLAADLARADDRTRLLQAARALHDWKGNR